jgi:hypothetical protein
MEQLSPMFPASYFVTNIGSLSGDGKTLYTYRDDAFFPHVAVWSLDAKGVKQTFLLPALDGANSIPGGVPFPPVIEAGPGGRTLALVRWPQSLDAHLVRFNPDGTDLRYRDLISNVGRIASPVWNKDGSWIFFARAGGAADAWQIWQVPAEGGAARFTGLEVIGLRHFDVNADDSRIIFSGRTYGILRPESVTLGPATPSPAARGGRGASPTR